MIHSLRAVLGALSLCLASNALAQSSPVPMLEHTAQHIIADLKAHQATLKTDHEVINKAIQSYLLPHVDIDGMSRSVLGREVWTKASSAEKKAFNQVFTQLIIRTYATPLAQYSGETVSFMPVREDLNGRFVRVNSIISRPNGQRIPLSYHLVAQAGDWKIYDLNVEGISLLQSFKLQFSGILQHGGTMSDLINQMRSIQQHKAA